MSTVRRLVVISGSDFEPRGSELETHRRILDALDDLGNYRFEYRPPRAIYDSPVPVAVVISEQNPVSDPRNTSTHEPRGQTPLPTLYMFHRYAGASTGGEAWYADEYAAGIKTRVLERTVDGRWVVARFDTVKAFLERVARSRRDDDLAPTDAHSMGHSSSREVLAPTLPSSAGGHVFVSYVRSDAPRVDRLVRALRLQGYPVWIDRDDLDAGTRWRQEIAAAIRSGMAMIACFSSAYAERDKTYMNEELTVAIEEIRARPTDRAWFIPVRLDDCPIPDRAIGGGEALRDIQSIDLFPEGVDIYGPLIRALARILPR